MAVMRPAIPKGNSNFQTYPVGIPIVPFKKHYDFYVKVINDSKLKNFFEDAILIKNELLKNAETKKETDIIEATSEIDKLQNIINEKLEKLASTDIKIVFPGEWFDKESLNYLILYDATFNNVYLSSEILKDFREHLEISKNTNTPKEIVSKIEEKYNEYLKNKPAFIKALKKSNDRYKVMSRSDPFLSMGANPKTLELRFMKTNYVSEAKDILKKSEEGVEAVINFIKSLTYEQMKLIVEIYDLVIQNIELAEIYRKEKEKIESDYENYINNIWTKSYEEFKTKDSNFITLEKRIIIEYYKMFLLKQIGKYKFEEKEPFNSETYREDIHDAIDYFLEINSDTLKDLDLDVTDHICNYIDNKLPTDKILKK